MSKGNDKHKHETVTESAVATARETAKELRDVHGALDSIEIDARYALGQLGGAPDQKYADPRRARDAVQRILERVKELRKEHTD